MKTRNVSAQTKAASANVDITTDLSILELWKDAERIQKGLDRYNEQTKSLGTSMLECAQRIGVDKFLDDCAAKEKAHRDAGKTAPRCWTQAKSNIKASVKLGVSVDDHATEGSLRKAVNEARKAKKEKVSEKAAQEEVAQLDVLDLLLARVNASFNDTNEREALASVLQNTVEAHLQGQLGSNQLDASVNDN